MRRTMKCVALAGDPVVRSGGSRRGQVLRCLGMLGVALALCGAGAVFAQTTDCYASQPGCLDGSFGSLGKAIGPDGFRPRGSVVQMVASQPRIVSVGALYDSRNRITSNWVVVRFLPNGAPDAGFGTAGFVKGDSSWASRFVAIQPDGRILVGGTGKPKGGKVNLPLVVRYAANGALDSSFGSGGVVAVPCSWSTKGCTAAGVNGGVAVQANGAIVTAANYGVGLAVTRLTASGAPDSTFNRIGQFMWTDASAVENAVNTVALQMVGSEQRVVLAGRTCSERFCPEGTDAALLIRVTAAGALDSGFGSGGVVRIDPGSLKHLPFEHLAIDVLGRAVAAGVAYNALPEPDHKTWLVVARFSTDGSLDASFGEAGVVVVGERLTDESLDGLAVQADAKILLSGRGTISGAQQAAEVWRLSDGGAADTTFGADGWVTVQFPDRSMHAAFGIVLPDPARLVIVGWVGPPAAGSTSAGLARLFQ